MCYMQCSFIGLLLVALAMLLSIITLILFTEDNHLNDTYVNATSLM